MDAKLPGSAMKWHHPVVYTIYFARGSVLQPVRMRSAFEWFASVFMPLADYCHSE